MSGPETQRRLVAEFEEQFGKLTARQLWVITKFAKMVRLRCRNNTAFNNACNVIFPYAAFKTITKHMPASTDGRYPAKDYPGLSIVVKGGVVGQTIEQDQLIDTYDGGDEQEDD